MQIFIIVMHISSRHITTFCWKEPASTLCKNKRFERFMLALQFVLACGVYSSRDEWTYLTLY